MRERVAYARGSAGLPRACALLVCGLFMYTTPAYAAPPLVLVVAADASDFVLAAGGTIAKMAEAGSAVYVIRVTNDEKDSWGLPPEETALRARAEADSAARALGVKEAISLGYRAAELADVSFSGIRDRLIFYIRHYKPSVMFIPNPYSEYDRVLDRYYTGAAAEDAFRVAALENFQLPHGDVGLAPHLTPELYYYAQPLDPRRKEPESTATFVPRPKSVDIASTLPKKLAAAAALKTSNESTARRLKARLDATGRRLPILDTVDESSIKRLAEINVRGLGTTEEFRYAGVEFRIPRKYR